MFAVSADFNYQPYNIVKPSGATFLAFIDDNEEDILKATLGLTLYNEFIEGLEEDYPAQKWLDLRDGATYQIEGDTALYEWKGLKTRKGAMVPYIYALWCLKDYKQASSSGITTLPKVENSEVLGPMQAVRAYNDCVQMLGWQKWSKNTLYGFLTANATDYESLVWTSPGRMSLFDL